MNDNNNVALVPKPAKALERTEPRAKRILSSMATDTLALAKGNVKTAIAAGYPVSILFSAEHIIPHLKSKERFAVIREMVRHLIHVGRIRPEDEDDVVDALNKREGLMSTGFGFGCASPRGRVDCVKDIVMAVGVSVSGVEFKALDDQPVHFFALFVAPANSQAHEVELQRFGAAIAKTLHKTDVREQLLRSNSAEEMWLVLKSVYDVWAHEKYPVDITRH